MSTIQAISLPSAHHTAAATSAPPVSPADPERATTIPKKRMAPDTNVNKSHHFAFNFKNFLSDHFTFSVSPASPHLATVQGFRSDILCSLYTSINPIPSSEDLKVFHVAYTLLEMTVTPEMIRRSENAVFIFGDNLLRYGLGGQAAVCRPFVDLGKAFGIPTKREPKNNENSYFADRKDEYDAVIESLKRIERMHDSGRDIFFLPCIGEGRAQLPSRSPGIYRLIQQFIVEKTGSVGSCNQ